MTHSLKLLRTNKGELLEEEWSPIIMYMYDGSDSEVIHEQLVDLVRSTHEKALEAVPEGTRADTAAAREHILQGIREGKLPYHVILQVCGLRESLEMHFRSDRRLGSA